MEMELQLELGVCGDPLRIYLLLLQVRAGFAFAREGRAQFESSVLPRVDE